MPRLVLAIPAWARDVASCPILRERLRLHRILQTRLPLLRAARVAARASPAARPVQRVRRLLTPSFYEALQATRKRRNQRGPSAKNRELVAWAERTVRAHDQALRARAGKDKRSAFSAAKSVRDGGDGKQGGQRHSGTVGAFKRARQIARRGPVEEDIIAVLRREKLAAVRVCKLGRRARPPSVDRWNLLLERGQPRGVSGKLWKAVASTLKRAIRGSQ